MPIMESDCKHVPYRVAISVLLVYLYPSCYYYTVVPSRFSFCDNHRETFVMWHSYRYGGIVAEWLFRPAHFLDTCVRPAFWRTYEVEYPLIKPSEQDKPVMTMTPETA